MSARSRCGLVAVVGAPNVGKSSLVNRAVGAKVAIVSPKPQTTRRRVLGVAMRDATQIVFVDTPGIFAPRRRLDRAMVASAWAGAQDADVVLFLVEAADALQVENRAILEKLSQVGVPIWLVINKIDIVAKPNLLKAAAALHEQFGFQRTFMISAKTGDGVDDLLSALAEAAPEGPHLFPPDQLTDLPMRLLAAEITREQLFRRLHQELPYALTVETESWEEFKDGSAKVSQVVYVEREGQKAIVVGQGGRQIKAVREAAQREIGEFTGRKVHLFLFVKTRENWQEDRERYREMGLEYDV